MEISMLPTMDLTGLMTAPGDTSAITAAPQAAPGEASPFGLLLAQAFGTTEVTPDVSTMTTPAPIPVTTPTGSEIPVAAEAPPAELLATLLTPVATPATTSPEPELSEVRTDDEAPAAEADSFTELPLTQGTLIPLLAQPTAPSPTNAATTEPANKMTPAITADLPLSAMAATPPPALPAETSVHELQTIAAPLQPPATPMAQPGIPAPSTAPPPAQEAAPMALNPGAQPAPTGTQPTPAGSTPTVTPQSNPPLFAAVEPAIATPVLPRAVAIEVAVREAIIETANADTAATTTGVDEAPAPRLEVGPNPALATGGKPAVHSEPAAVLPEPVTVSHDSLISQVRERLASHNLKTEGNQVRLQLNPEELGSLQITLRMDDQKLRIEIMAENKAVKTALLEHMDTLKDVLARQQITVDRFDVNTGTGGGFGQLFREGGRPEEQQRHPKYALATGVRTEPAVSAQPAWQPRQHALVDVRL